MLCTKPFSKPVLKFSDHLTKVNIKLITRTTSKSFDKFGKMLAVLQFSFTFRDSFLYIEFISACFVSSSKKSLFAELLKLARKKKLNCLYYLLYFLLEQHAADFFHASELVMFMILFLHSRVINSEEEQLVEFMISCINWVNFGTSPLLLLQLHCQKMLLEPSISRCLIVLPKYFQDNSFSSESILLFAIKINF